MVRCRERESNSHFRIDGNKILSLACLPVPPPRLGGTKPNGFRACLASELPSVRFPTIFPKLIRQRKHFKPTLDATYILFTNSSYKISSMSGRRELDPLPSPWQGDVLPVNYSRFKTSFFSASAIN